RNTSPNWRRSQLELPRLSSCCRPSSPAGHHRRFRVAARLSTREPSLCALSPFFVNAEPRGGAKGGHWGTTTDRLIAGVWVAALAAIVGYGTLHDRRSKRRKMES